MPTIGVLASLLVQAAKEEGMTPEEVEALLDELFLQPEDAAAPPQQSLPFNTGTSMSSEDVAALAPVSVNGSLPIDSGSNPVQ